MPVKISALRAFLTGEAAGGMVLIAAAALAMIAANSPWSATYFDSLHIRIGAMSALHWINDGLMSLFFLLVGLEIKREFIDGHLSSWASRTLPVAAALGGMAIPALLYLAIAGGMPGLARGWAIPAATDIAFAIGVMALLGKRVPASLKLFLTTVAIVDDMGAVAIIALAYTDNISGLALLAALGIMGMMFLLNRARVTRLLPFMILAFLLWLAILLSGIHATIAGVLAATLIPIRTSPGAPDSEESPLHRLEHGLHPWVAFGIVPLFGFANAGVSFAGIGVEHLLSPLPLGIAVALFLGKQTGVFSALWLCHRTGIAPRPGGATWLQIYGVCILCGIGFTMSLFIGGLAFNDPMLVDEVKIGVFVGSIASAILGFGLLSAASKTPAAQHRP